MSEGNVNVACGGQLQREFHHLKSQWWLLCLYGALLVVCGTAAVVFPAVTVSLSFVAVVVLGVSLIIGGVATIIAAFWAGKWSGILIELLVGILYVMVGFIISDTPVESLATITVLVAAFFIVAGLFRSIAALVIRFPYWGWSLLNGIVTFLLGMMIYRLCHHFPGSVLWVLGLLIGLEMLFHGWTWIMLSLAVKKLPDQAA